MSRKYTSKHGSVTLQPSLSMSFCNFFLFVIKLFYTYLEANLMKLFNGKWILECYCNWFEIEIWEVEEEINWNCRILIKRRFLTSILIFFRSNQIILLNLIRFFFNFNLIFARILYSQFFYRKIDPLIIKKINSMALNIFPPNCIINLNNFFLKFKILTNYVKIRSSILK